MLSIPILYIIYGQDVPLIFPDCFEPFTWSPLIFHKQIELPGQTTMLGTIIRVEMTHILKDCGE